MKLSLEQVGIEIAKFTEQDVETVARETKFVQRESGLNGQRFLQAMVFGCIEKSEPGLNGFAQVCADLGVEITAQGLDQRITEKAVAFLKRVLARAMDQFKNQIPPSLEILQQFIGHVQSGHV